MVLAESWEHLYDHMIAPFFSPHHNGLPQPQAPFFFFHEGKALGKDGHYLVRASGDIKYIGAAISGLSRPLRVKVEGQEFLQKMDFSKGET